jgi:hypothetical protein
MVPISFGNFSGIEDEYEYDLMCARMWGIKVLETYATYIGFHDDANFLAMGL